MQIAEPDISFLRTQNFKRPVNPPLDKISSYSEKRVLPTGTPFPGRWDNAHTPYGIEIMDNMSPWSNIRHTAVMKAPQLGFTAIAENVTCYWMDESPADILYISATEQLLMKWA